MICNDFDDYADSYDSLLEGALAPFGDIGYLGESKVRLMKKMFCDAEEPKTILDFGCGIGRNLPYLQSFFPGAKIYAFDVSKKSLDIALQRNPEITPINEQKIDSYQSFFDAIFVSGVFHHVVPEGRDDVIGRLRNLVSQHGRLVVFEHNPLNPITRRVVKKYIIDKDAVLISRKELTEIFSQNGFLLDRSSYILFVPPKFKILGFIESFLFWLPLGGQYCAVFKRKY